MCILMSVSISTTISASADETYDNGRNTEFVFFGLGFALCSIFFIIWFIVFIVIALWVYKDAEKRGSSGALWLIIVLLAGIIGIIIWLIVRPPIGGKPKQTTGRFCPSCGKSIPSDAVVCPYCGKKFS